MALYYNLPVYKASLKLVRAVYECSGNFAREYKYTTGQDMKKAALLARISFSPDMRKAFVTPHEA